MRFRIVDVFAEAPLEGNPLAVFEDAAGLDGAAMQAIARELNLSETTFVTQRSAGRASVRIFTPGTELPFAGHPTLGTAWALTGGARDIVLELGAGEVAVRFDEGLAWMTPPPAVFGGPLARERAAALVGLDAAELHPEHAPAVATCGPTFALVFVRSLEALKRVRVRFEHLDSLRDAAAPGVFAVCEPGYAPGHLGARMLFHDGVGLREDPATGSANACLAHDLAARGRRGRFVVDQGIEIERPSRIYLEVGEPIEVGGRVSPVAEGRFAAGSPASVSPPASPAGT